MATVPDEAVATSSYAEPAAKGAAAIRRRGAARTEMGAYPEAQGEFIRDLLTVLVEAERCAIRTTSAPTPPARTIGPTSPASCPPMSASPATDDEEPAIKVRRKTTTWSSLEVDGRNLQVRMDPG